MRARVLGLVAVAALALTACGRQIVDRKPASPTPTRSPTTYESPTATETGTGVRAEFVEPVDGAVVSSPVQVRMRATGITIAPAAKGQAGAGHFHIMTDVECVQPGAAIPNDPTHRHFGDGSTTATIELAPGQHTLCLQVGDNGHVASGATDRIMVAVR